MTRAIVTTEAPAAPFLLSLYADDGLAGGGVELSAVAALHLALDLLKHVTPKLSQRGCWLVSTTRACQPIEFKRSSCA